MKGKYIRTKEFRERMSKRFKGRVMPEEQKRKVSEGLKRYYSTHEHPRKGVGGKSYISSCSGYRMFWVDGKGKSEHKIIAEKAIGRPLKRTELIHHINGDKLDNRNCNLLICTKSYHGWLHWLMSRLYQEEHFATRGKGA